VSRRTAVCLVAAAVAMVAYCAAELRLGTDVTHFMPDGSGSELARVSALLTDSAFTRTMVVSVGAGEPAIAIAAARELAASLRAHPEVAWVRSALDDAQLEPLFELYFPRRHYFLSEDPEREIPTLLAEPALRERARELKRRLASPAAAVFEPLASADPLGSFPRIAERLRGDDSSLRIEGGQFVSRDGRHAILLLGTRASAFDSGRQSRLLADLRGAFDGIARRLGGELVLEISGANRFAVAAEQSIKRDVYRIAACSFFGVAAVFLLFVGSLRGFLVVSLPPLAGILVATTAGLALFGELDGLTMAFGASLMGIAIDYSNHLLLHHGLGPPAETPGATALRIRPSLSLGALTTVASLVGLAITAFPAFREMSFFATVGVLTGLGVTLFVLPDLLAGVPPLPARSATTAARLAGLFRRLDRAPRALVLAPVVVALLGVVALPRLRWQDDMSRLTRFDPELLAEEKRVRERVSRLDTGRFVIGVAPDASAAVALDERIRERLRRVIDAGGLDGSRSLHTLLWSEQLQRRNGALVASDAGLVERVDAVFGEEGFRRGAFRPFAEALEQSPPPLTLADLQQSPLAELLAPFVFALGDELAVVTYLRGLRSPEAVRSALADLDGVHLLDQRGFVNEIYGEFRQTTLRQMLVGALFVVLLLVVRYRAWRPVVASFLPSAVVVLLLLETFALAGVEANLLHVMSLIMVMGMGVDYGIFLVDSTQRGEALGSTMLSLLLSCLTTVFVFGTLTLSSQPSLRAIGVTTGLGVLLSYLLAPLALTASGLLAGSRGRHG
jgi:predicted exporter